MFIFILSKRVKLTEKMNAAAVIDQHISSVDLDRRISEAKNKRSRTD